MDDPTVFLTEQTLKELLQAVEQAKPCKFSQIRVVSPHNPLTFQIALDCNNSQESLGYKTDNSWGVVHLKQKKS